MLVSLGLSIFRWLLTSWSHLCTELSVDPAAYQHRFTPYFDGIKNQSTCPEIRRYVTDHTSDFFSSLAPGSTHDDRFSAAFFGSRLGARNFDPPSCYIKCFELILDTLNLILCARQKIVESYHVWAWIVWCDGNCIRGLIGQRAPSHTLAYHTACKRRFQPDHVHVQLKASRYWSIVLFLTTAYLYSWSICTCTLEWCRGCRDRTCIYQRNIQRAYVLPRYESSWLIPTDWVGCEGETSCGTTAWHCGKRLLTPVLEIIMSLASLVHFPRRNKCMYLSKRADFKLLKIFSSFRKLVAISECNGFWW